MQAAVWVGRIGLHRRAPLKPAADTRARAE